jgi:hypothetical protein
MKVQTRAGLDQKKRNRVNELQVKAGETPPFVSGYGTLNHFMYNKSDDA